MSPTTWTIFVLSVGVFGATKGDYIAAVVEFNPINRTEPYLTLEENINEYTLQIGSAKLVQAQIIVFPEYGLTGLVQDPENYSLSVPSVGTIPSKDTDYFLVRLSDAAREHGIYVVVNLLEKTNRTRNDVNETIYYNTNVVFDKSGTIIAKYRKINPYNEPQLTAGNETVVFDTDFGTSFALITCNDILFYDPAQTVLRNVTDVIFVAAWTSVLPFFSALQVQAGYATANGVNLLAANLNNPAAGRSGSGIYRKDGTILRQVISGTPSTSLLFANVESIVQAKNFSTFGFGILRNETTDPLVGFETFRDFKPDSYIFKSLDLSMNGNNVTGEVCHKSFCCNFNVVVNQANATEIYKVLAYDGSQKIDTVAVPVKWCALIGCQSDDVSTCGVRQTFTTRFSQITIWGNFENRPGSFYRPTSLRGDLRSVSNVTYLENRANDSIGISLSTRRVENNVVVFGIMGTGGGSTFGISLILVGALAALINRVF